MHVLLKDLNDSPLLQCVSQLHSTLSYWPLGPRTTCSTVSISYNIGMSPNRRSKDPLSDRESLWWSRGGQFSDSELQQWCQPRSYLHLVQVNYRSFLQGDEAGTIPRLQKDPVFRLWTILLSSSDCAKDNIWVDQYYGEMWVKHIFYIILQMFKINKWILSTLFVSKLIMQCTQKRLYFLIVIIFNTLMNINVTAVLHVSICLQMGLNTHQRYQVPLVK